MFFDSQLFNTIILLGAFQGFIISSLLFFSKKNRQSNRILAVLIFLISLACLNIYFAHQTFFDNWGFQLFIAIVPMVVAMPLGPLIFFYVRSSLDPDFRITKKQYIHFYPVILDLFQHIVALLYIVGLITGIIKKNDQPIGVFIDDYDTYVDIPRWISVTIYLGLATRYIASFKTKNNLNGHTDIPKWVKEFVRVFIVFQCIWLIHLIPYIIPRYSNALLNWGDWYPLYIPLAIIIYWLGIKGYLISQHNYGSIKKIGTLNSSLSSTTVEQVIRLLKKAMEEEKLYLNTNLNLNILSAHIDIPQKVISSVLNQHLNKSFSEFVNAYRVEAFKEKIRQPDMDHLTIAGVALECGFNSQATFQRIFKQFTGLSPSAFRDNMLEIQ